MISAAVAVALMAAGASEAAAQDIPKGRTATLPPPKANIDAVRPEGRVPARLAVTMLRPPEYRQPLLGYRVSIANVSAVTIDCSVSASEGFGGSYRIGGGAEFSYFVEREDEPIALRCDKVEGGRPLINVLPNKRYIFGRKSLGPLRWGPVRFHVVE
ncbi:hypothetical protein [Caulobacter mirabilis]|nr:hypothetical protein [Caulobacter mirabilis]